MPLHSRAFARRPSAPAATVRFAIRAVSIAASLAASALLASCKDDGGQPAPAAATPRPPAVARPARR